LNPFKNKNNDPRNKSPDSGGKNGSKLNSYQVKSNESHIIDKGEGSSRSKTSIEHNTEIVLTPTGIKNREHT